jgi:hypothetical protein
MTRDSYFNRWIKLVNCASKRVVHAVGACQTRVKQLRASWLGETNNAGNAEGEQPVERPSAVMLGILLVVSIFAMSGVMHAIMGLDYASGKTARLWTFWECVYFTVVTVTVVGLGDYVPQMHRLWLQFWLILITWAIFAAAIQVNEGVPARKTETAASEVGVKGGGCLYPGHPGGLVLVVAQPLRLSTVCAREEFSSD